MLPPTLKRTIPLALLSLCLLPWGAAAAPAGAGELTVFAAASLTDALTEIAVAYEGAGGDRVTIQFGASSTLARQIEHGAPADVLLSADDAQMDALAAKGRILQDTRRSLLSNTLVIVVPVDSALTLASPGDLAGGGVKRLALANPQAVPAGVYAREYLIRFRLWDQLAPRVVPTENVRGALAAVESGNVEAAIVYKTDAAISRQVRIAYEVAPADGPPIRYPGAVVADAAHPAAARRFLAHLRSDAAAAVFARHGFRRAD